MRRTLSLSLLILACCGSPTPAAPAVRVPPRDVPTAGDSAVPQVDRLASSPGQVRCGSTTCTAGEEHCCVGEAGARCRSLDERCDATDTILECDERADCVGDQHCCPHANCDDCPPALLCLARARGEMTRNELGGCVAAEEGPPGLKLCDNPDPH